jgi:hypothetical protein
VQVQRPLAIQLRASAPGAKQGRANVLRSSIIDSSWRDWGSWRGRVAHRPAVGSIAASIGVIGLSRSAVQVRDAWRSPSSALGCDWAASTVLVESIPDSVRLSSEWCVVKKRKREDLTKPCSRIAATSCGMVSRLAAIC